jgi:hypothetical protein
MQFVESGDVTQNGLPIEDYYVGFEVLTAVTMKRMVLRVVMLFSSEIDQCFRGTYYISPSLGSKSKAYCLLLAGLTLLPWRWRCYLKMSCFF